MFLDQCQALDESPALEESLCRPVRFPVSATGGLAHYTGRNFERPFISYSVNPKLYHPATQVKLLHSISIHK